MLDISGSMEGERIANLRRALANLTGLDTSITGQFARFRSRETVVMLPFNHDPQEPTTFAIKDTRVDSPDMKALRAYVNKLHANGGTAIYDALLQAMRIGADAASEHPDRFYSIVLLTDGESQRGAGHSDFKRHYRRLPDAARGVRVFPILFGDTNVSEMESVGELTGGRTFDAKKHSLSLIFKKIRGYQ